MTDVLNFDARKPDSDDEGTGEIPIFTIKGKTYSIPKKARVNVALGYLRDVRKHGAEFAAGKLMEAMLGEEAYDALVEYDDLTPEDLAKVMEAVQQVAMGELEEEPEQSASSDGIA